MTTANVPVTGSVSISSMGTGLSTATIATSSVTIPQTRVEDIIDKYALNEFTVEHRVQEQELLKLKEQNVDYADAIKENMAKNMARDVIKKVSFTKKFEQDTFVHSFRGRCWVFTKEELINLIQDIKNGI